MRTSITQNERDRAGNDASHDRQEYAHDNPRRRREPHDEREDDDPNKGGAGSTREHKTW